MANRLYFINDTTNTAVAYDFDGTRQSTDDISLGTGSWQGGVASDDRLYFINDTTNTAVAYDFDGTRQSTDDISLGNGVWAGGTSANNRLYFINFQTPTSLTAYDFDGSRQSLSDITIISRSWLGTISSDNRIYIVDTGNLIAIAYDFSGNRQSTDDISLGIGSWQGGVASDDRLYFINDTTNTAVAYDFDGTRQSTDDISLGSGTWRGGTSIIEDSATLTISTTDTDIRPGESVNINIASDIDISDFAAGDVTVTNGTRGTLTRTDAQNYVLAVTAGSAGTMTIAMAEDVVSPGNAAVSQDFTVKLALPSVPASLAATVVDHDSIRITFDASTGTVSRYEYRYATSQSGLSSATWNSAGTSRSVTIDGLSANTLYYFQVRAVNADGNSAASSAVSARTTVLIVAPGTPGTLTATAVDHDSVRLNFGASSGTVTQYQYRYATTSGGLSSASWNNGGTGTTIDVDGLSASTQYYFQVRAGNQGRYSAASNTANATTQVAPQVIGTYYFIQDSGNAIAYDFDKDNNTTRNSSKDRNLNTLTGSTRILGAVATSNRIAVLDSGTTKAIRILNRDFTRVAAEDVTLSNQIYTAICATDDRWVVSRATPSWRLEFWDFSGTEQVSERQTPPTRGNNGLFSYDDYIYIISNIDDDVSRRTFDDTTISTFISSLGTGSWNGGAATSSRFVFVNDSGDTAVFANHAGTIQSSEQITLPSGTYVAVLAVEDVQLTAPSVPASLSAAAVDHDTIRLSFSASTGTVTQYQYRVATTSGGLSSATWVNGGTGTTIDVDSLNPSTRYYFQVRALNQTVASAASNTADATTKAPPIIAPGTPASLSATAVDHDTIRLVIGASTGTVTQRQYRYATSTAGLASATWQNASATTVDVDGLSANTTYYFQARAGNQGVYSGASTTASAKTDSAPIVAPSTPPRFTITVIDHDSVRLNFGASTGTVTQYQYRYATSEAGLASAAWNNGGTGTTITVDNLSANTLYYFQVRAGNQGAYSAATASASATTRVEDTGPVTIGAISSPISILLDADWELNVRITGNPDSVEVIGDLYYFDYDFQNPTLRLFGKPESIFSISFLIEATKDGKITRSPSVIINVVLPAPIIVDVEPPPIVQGAPYEFFIPVVNNFGIESFKGLWTGLGFTVHEQEGAPGVLLKGIPSRTNRTVSRSEMTLRVVNETNHDEAKYAPAIASSDDFVFAFVRDTRNVFRITHYNGVIYYVPATITTFTQTERHIGSDADYLYFLGRGDTSSTIFRIPRAGDTLGETFSELPVAIGFSATAVSTAFGGIAADGSNIFLGGDNGYIFVLGKDGSSQRRFQLSGVSSLQAIAVDGNSIVALHGTSRLYLDWFPKATANNANASRTKRVQTDSRVNTTDYVGDIAVKGDNIFLALYFTDNPTPQSFPSLISISKNLANGSSFLRSSGNFVQYNPRFTDNSHIGIAD